MGLETHSKQVTGGSHRDSHDFQRLRHAREQHVGC
jgi:hypothetical protein